MLESGVGSDVDRREYTYDAAGNVATLVKGTGSDAAVWQYAHGPRGELLTVTPQEGSAYQYRYDVELRLASVTPPGTDEAGSGAVLQTYDWDYLGRPRGRTRGTSIWTTDWVAGESATADQNGDVVKTLLDGRGRRARQRWQPGVASQPYTDLTAFVLAYDGLDQVTQAVETRASGDVTVSYGYDSRSRLTRIDRGGDAWVKYGYALGMDERGSVQSPAGTISYGYDGKGRLGTVTSSRGTVTLGWEDGGERLLSASDGALQQCWNHDLRGRVTSVENLPPGAMCNAGTQPYARYEYGYDERGNRKQETYVEGYGLSDETSYGYDRADRLVGVSSLGTGQTKLYGLGGDGTRRCEKTIQGTVPLGSGCDGADSALEHLAYRYDGAGGLKQLVDGANGQELATYTTDPAGRLKSEVRGTTTRSYGWDAGGRLAQTTVSTAIAGAGAGVTTLQYRYDWSGRRVSRTTSDLTTAYLWGDGELVEERLPGRTVLYENGAGMALAAGGERLMYDALGSAVGRVGASGTPALYRYDAWGSYRGNAPGSSDPSAGYAGQHWDGDAGLSYAQQRWYDPRSGRFLSEDPVFGDLQNPSSLMAFGYANGNPLRYIDPSGEKGACPGSDTLTTHCVQIVNGEVVEVAAEEAPNVVARPLWQRILAAVGVGAYGAGAVNQPATEMDQSPKIYEDLQEHCRRGDPGWNCPSNPPGIQQQPHTSPQSPPGAAPAVPGTGNEVRIPVNPDDLGKPQKPPVIVQQDGSGTPRSGPIAQGDAGGNGGGQSKTGGAPAKEKQGDLAADDLRDKTPAEIAKLAKEQGWVPFGQPDPATGDPRKWKDPVTGKERLRLDKGHVDKKTGLPYNDPKAADDHVHGYDEKGDKVRDDDNNPHFPTKKD